LLAIVLSLVVEQAWPTLVELRSFTWFEAYVDRLYRKWGKARIGSGPFGVIAVLAVPLLVVAIVQVFLSALLGILGFIFAVSVLLFCLGPRNLDSDVRAFLNDWEQNDPRKAREDALHIRDFTNQASGEQSLIRGVVEDILVAAHERWFGVIFWFTVLGPIGALWYRLACVLRAGRENQIDHSAFAAAAVTMHDILAWIPARLTALGYALAGSFADAVHLWRDEASAWKKNGLAANRRILVVGGLGALQLGRESAEGKSVADASQVRAALALVWRTLILAVAVLAVGLLGALVS
jgi:membrane protein required for beta-lactamase induction